MKKFILPLFAIFAMFSCSNNNDDPEVITPLVITKADYLTNFKANGAVYANFDVESSAVTIPVAGENQTWDFSKLTETGSFLNGGTSFFAPSNAAFPSATYSYSAFDSYTISGVFSNEFGATFFVEISDSGAYTLGNSQDGGASINVTSIGAVISYEAQNRNFTGVTKLPAILFPAKFGDTAITTNGIINTSSFTVNAPAFGLSNAPGQTKITTDIIQEVIASGKANLKGIGEKRVIVTKSNISETTNFFLGGAPAPTQLLTLLGATDGSVSTSTTYRFVAEGLGTVGTINVDASGSIIYANFRKGF